MTVNRVGSVSGIWRFPVKSLGGERLQLADVSSSGLLGDRAFALVDVSTGKVVSAKSLTQFPGVLDWHAAFVEPPQAGHDLPPVRITLPGGQAVRSDATDVDTVLSAHVGRRVRLARSAPADFTIDQYHPDVEGADPAGHRDRSVEQRLGSALFAQMGLPSPVAEGAFFDVCPVSVLTTSTLTRLSELAPRSRWDERRFRMNVIVETAGAGFVENAWVGCSVALGDGARLRVLMPDPRCVMTTLAQGDLPHDLDILRTPVRYNRLALTGGSLYPCVGVYAVTEAGGPVRVGDQVALA